MGLVWVFGRYGYLAVYRFTANLQYYNLLQLQYLQFTAAWLQCWSASYLAALA